MGEGGAIKWSGFWDRKRAKKYYKFIGTLKGREIIIWGLDLKKRERGGKER